MKELLTVLDRAMYRLDDLIRKDAAVDKVARVKAKELAILERIAVSRKRMDELKTEWVPSWFTEEYVQKAVRKNFRNRIMRAAMHTILVSELARLSREGVSGEDLTNLMIYK